MTIDLTDEQRRALLAVVDATPIATRVSVLLGSS
jgi:hypothetical protein